ncbi:MAG: DNA polymerase III subunit alpha, partial [Candidatus Niyogibacteria bacterium]|nr:DNA polymerase III subunit alpha [Candidatus Niyogibacteria bacterium]
LDGLAKIDELVSEAARLGMPALALTDHGNMYGAVEFYKKAKSAGIKPILGVEIYVAPRSMKDKTPGIDDKRYHLILLAKNNEGYKNLIKLVTLAHLEGFYYKPRIDKETLRQYSKGLIALSACLSGEIPRALFTKNKNGAKELLREYKEIFGEENFFLELSHHPNIPNHKRIQDALIALARETETAVVASQDIHYLKSDDAKAQDILLAVQTNSKLDDEDRLTMQDDDFSMTPPEIMKEHFKEIPEAVENTVKIADMCDLKLELGKLQLPHFPTPNGESPEDFLNTLCEQGIQKRYNGNPNQEAKERLTYELSVIRKTNFSSYFLIVQDFVNWAKGQGIIVGPGRGSAAGSLIAYVLNITDIDPLKYDLLFERFMNPDRISPPDIDLDFADTRRDEVLHYVTKKYGNDHVAQIITFGTMAARAAIRDTGRALGLSYGFCDQTAKMIPFGSSLKEALDDVAEFKAAYENNADTKRLVDFAKKLEGVARHASTHACGVVITKDPLTDMIPLQYATTGSGDNKIQAIVTQYEMHAVEDLGLLKMDFLGLSNLSIIEETLARIKRLHGEEIAINQIPLDDLKTYRLLSRGNTVGVFQLESAGMQRYIKELKPSSLEDIIAMVALYRPGPMEFLPSYLARKNGQEKITYLHPKMEPVLKNTYGIMIYQEQLMRVARDLAGFSMSEADILRKAVGKKIKKLMDEQAEKFIAGVGKTIGSKELGEKLWRWIEPFARYGFNRSHSAGYALVAYQTAYLKAHYPKEYMVSLLNSDAKDIERMSFLIQDAKNTGIEVMPPDINESEVGFTVAGDKIRFGLGAVKNVGHNIVSSVVTEREQNGDFSSLENFLERISSKDLNRRSLEALIKSGALDSLGERNAMLKNLPIVLDYQKETKDAKIKNQSSLFALMEDRSSAPSLKLAETPPASLNEKLKWERELLGLYISGHPLDEFRDTLNQHKMKIPQIRSMRDGAQVTAIGMVENGKTIVTKTGKPMMFLTLNDSAANIEVVVFPDALTSYGHLLQAENVVKIKGRVSLRQGTPSIVCNTVESLSRIA